MATRVGSDATPARLQGLWLYRMILTARPLRERMTLFWHNHFATSLSKVQNPVLMQRQNGLLREHALGNFRAMLAAVGKDPAMLVWLDATANRKAKPNENYAREVMELFTLGRGRYTEKDIQEAARAFTGWFVVRDRFSMLPTQHDDGVKTIFGKTGRFRGEDVPGLLLDQPACAEFLAAKLYRQFVNEVDTPAPTLLAPLAKSLRSSDYDIAAAVRMILRSNLFFDRRRCDGIGSSRRSSWPSARSGRSRSSSRRSRPRGWPMRRRGWGRRSTPHRASPAGTAARPGSTPRPCSTGRISPSRCSATTMASWAAVAMPRGSPPSTASSRGSSMWICSSRTPSIPRCSAPSRSRRELATLVLTTPEYQLA